MLRTHNLWPVTSFELIPLALGNSLVKLREILLNCTLLCIIALWLCCWVDSLSAAALWRRRRRADGWLLRGGPEGPRCSGGKSSALAPGKHLRALLLSRSPSEQTFPRPGLPRERKASLVLAWLKAPVLVQPVVLLGSWTKCRDPCLIYVRRLPLQINQRIRGGRPRVRGPLCAEEQSPGRGTGLPPSPYFCLLGHRLLEPQCRENSLIFSWVLSLTESKVMSPPCIWKVLCFVYPKQTGRRRAAV